MSVHLAPQRLRSSLAAPSKTLPLRLVGPVTNRARRAPFVVVVLAVVGIGLVGLILISTVLQAQAFELTRLQSEAAELQIKQQGLERDVDQLQAPAAVAERAMRQGMVPNSNPVFLDPAAGDVIGRPGPAKPRTNVSGVGR